MRKRKKNELMIALTVDTLDNTLVRYDINNLPIVDFIVCNLKKNVVQPIPTFLLFTSVERL